GFRIEDCTFVTTHEGNSKAQLPFREIQFFKDYAEYTLPDTSHRKTLSINDVRNSNANFNCAPTQTTPNCNRNLCYHLRFRSFDGTCNNFDKPLIGSAFSALMRLKDPMYDNGLNAPTCKLAKFTYCSESWLCARRCATTVPDALPMPN
ncbi:hypothetical protein OESDEN_23363, partial [Oesophagostomum dentatum]